MAQTPMMSQYLGFKNQYPDKIVLFRMGDFFETFGEDAKLTSKILNITLTSRDRKTDPTPLAGFPHHALNQYIPKIISAGYCAVIVDQIEDPKAAKGIVKRAVTRIVTPSTLDQSDASSGKKQYLSTFFRQKKQINAAFLDISTGEFLYTSVQDSKTSLSNLLTMYEPAEVVILDNEKGMFFPDFPVSLLPKSQGKAEYSLLQLKKFFKVSDVEALGLEADDSVVVPLAMALGYIQETQKVSPEHVIKPKRFNLSNTMILDRATVNNLELVRSSYTGDASGSLFSVIDHTLTLMGKRLLYSWLLSPLIEIIPIKQRLKIVTYLVNSPEVLTQIRVLLDGINDIERLVGKIGLNRVNARDLKALQLSLVRAMQIKESLNDLNKHFSTVFVDKSVKKQIDELITLLDNAIEENPPVLITEGHIVKPSYDKEIEELRKLTVDTKSWIKEFESQERERTGIGSLKIAYTKVFGYYIEVTHTHHEKVPSDYIRKQTLVNSERYVTQELKDKEELILNSQERLATLEYKVFQKIREKCLPIIPTLQSVASDIAFLDVLAGFAHLATTRNYCEPKINDFGKREGIISIKDGRHPVVEVNLSDEFVTNDTFLNLGSDRMAILTGPNMSGKSTYIRQVATLVLMAQIGCFVPAKECEVSLVDRIFTRVGASDDLARGRSTFMVEMDEAANIVSSATRFSLIILDEIGRGTSTYDGVSIAWSLAEYISKEVKARTLFATHYHELLKLAEKVEEGVKNYNVLVDENTSKGTVVFLRKIVEGGTNRSYGIYVAQMAGLPTKVIQRAYEILEGFEQESMFANASKLRDTDIPPVQSEKRVKEKEMKALQIPLFELSDNEITNELKDLDLDNLTPLESLNLIHKWKDSLK
ncbi:DNA mismatch repair protein MutS [bacterium]|nr:DNA mismatch repair protein MutS [bacterium]